MKTKAYRMRPMDAREENILGIRRFARVAGVRNAATALRKQGMPLPDAIRALASIRLADALKSA